VGSIDTNFNYFGDHNKCQCWAFSLYDIIQLSLFLFHLIKIDWKMIKIKFGIKIEFLEIGDWSPIKLKRWGTKLKFLDEIRIRHLFLLVFFTLIIYFLISPSLKKRNWLAINLGLKKFNYTLQKIDDQIRFFLKKKSLFQFTMIYEKVNNK